MPEWCTAISVIVGVYTSVGTFPVSATRSREVVTLYCPAPLLHAGENIVTVLELRDRPELGPPEEYVEEFG